MVKKELEEIMKNACLIDDILFLDSLPEKSVSDQTFKLGYTDYMCQKYSLTPKEFQRTYFLVTLNEYNKYLHLYDDGKYKFRKKD